MVLVNNGSPFHTYLISKRLIKRTGTIRFITVTLLGGEGKCCTFIIFYDNTPPLVPLGRVANNTNCLDAWVNKVIRTFAIISG